MVFGHTRFQLQAEREEHSADLFALFYNGWRVAIKCDRISIIAN